MNSLNVRQAFVNQNGQCLIVDAQDLSLLFLKSISKALQDVLTIACSVRGGVRIPAFALSVLKKGVNDVYEFDVIRGNYNKIIAAINSLSTYCQMNDETSDQEYKDSLYLAIDSMIQKFSVNQGKSEWIHNISQIEITVITTKSCKLIRSYLETFIQSMEVSKIHKITIIELQYSDYDIPENAAGFIRTIILNGSTHLQVERFFKHWLLDQCGDIDAILHFPGPPSSHLALKCDISECIMNPLSLPFGHRVYLAVDALSVQMSGMSIAKTSISSIPVHELNILSRIPSNDICESMIFGLPLCLRPSHSWRLSVDEEKANKELFFELCRQLMAADQVLLVRMKSPLQTDQFSPYFILTPGECCFLVKSMASADITLPWKQDDLPILASVENTVRVMKNLQNLETTENFNLENYESGLFLALTANLKHAGKSSNCLTSDENPCLKRFKRSK